MKDNEYNYGWEKLHLAVSSLVDAPTIGRRMMGALQQLMRLDPQVHLPPSIRTDFMEFMELFRTGKPMGDEGLFQASISEMSDTALGEAAQKVLSMYDTVCRYQRRD